MGDITPGYGFGHSVFVLTIRELLISR